MQVVVLPSGHKAPLEPADLRRLLACGGTTSGLCHAVWAHPAVDVESVVACDRGDATAIARWALLDFSRTDEAAELTAVCQQFGEAPSQRLCVPDRALAFEFDQACLVTLERLTDEHKDQAARPGGFNSGASNG